MKKDILPLNLLRFFAALNILIVHKFEQLVSLGYLPSFFKVFSPFAQYGYLGVDLFFMISGFVIVFSSEERTAKQFIFARFFRLFPVFWVCMTITSIVIIGLSDTLHVSLFQYLANLTMIPQSFGDIDFIDGSYWTLGIELSFYFFIAVLLALKSRFKLSIQNMALVFSLLIAVQSLFYMTEPTSFSSSLVVFFLYSSWGGYAHYFIAGILFYGIYQNSKRYYHYPAILLCYAVSIFQAFKKSYVSNDKMVLILYLTTFFILFFLISLKKITNESFQFLGQHYRKIIVFLGAVTYPLYLLHDVITQVMVENFTLYKLPMYIASPLLFIILVSLIVFVNRIDFYINTKWKQKFVKEVG